jgi:hypothetical protein
LPLSKRHCGDDRDQRRRPANDVITNDESVVGAGLDRHWPRNVC